MMKYKGLFLVNNGDIRNLSRELYDEENSGCASIQGFLVPDFTKKLLAESERLSHTVEGKERSYIGPRGPNLCQEYTFPQGGFPAASQLIEQYSALLLHEWESVIVKPNMMVLYKYIPGFCEFPAIQAPPCYRNMISYFILTGKTPFYINANGNVRYEIKTMPDSLVLIRAPRSRKESRNRPHVGIEEVDEEMYVLCLKQKK